MRASLVTVGVVVAIPIGLWLADSLTPSVVRRALPVTASDVREYYSDDGFHGDFLRCLRAKMPRTEMPRFAAKLGLTQRYRMGRDSKLPVSFSAGSEAPWWHSPETLEGAYFEYTSGNEGYAVATYQDGYVYYLVTAW